MANDTKQKLAITTLCLFFAMPLFQMANTFFLKQGFVFSNVGQLYTILLLGLCFYFSEKKIRNIYIVLGFFGFVIILLHKFVLTHGQSTSAFVVDIIQFVKISAIGLFVTGLQGVFQTLKLESQQLYKIFRIGLYVALAIFVLNIILGVAGFGETQYALGYGYKGFFYSGNEFAVALVTTATILLYVLYTLNKKYEAFILSLGLVILGPIQGMKTVILGLFIAVLLAPITYLLSIHGLKIFSKKLLVVLSGVGIAALTVAIGFYLLFPTHPFFVRFQEIYARGGLLSAITGERNQTVKQAWLVYATQFTPGEQLLGVGKTETELRVGQYYIYKTKAIEVDPIDLLLQFGILGCVIFYGVWCLIIFNTYKQKNYIAVGTSLLLLVLSTLSGHIIFSTFVTLYWSIVFSMCTHNKKELRPTIVFLGATEKGGIGTYMIETAQYLKSEFAVDTIRTQTQKLYQTILLFPLAVLKMKIAVLESLFSGKSVIFHYHMATKGSFVRKYLFALLFRPFVDKQILHLHGAKSAEFLAQILKFPGMNSALSLFFSLFDNIIIVSNTLYTEVTSVLKKHNISYHPERWSTLFNAIELPKQAISPHPFKKGDTFNIIFVGRLVPQKNVSLLITILEQLHSNKLPVHLTIVGDGPDRQSLVDLVRAKKLDKHVSFLGWIDHNKLDTLYQRHHLFAITSRYESFGIVVLEAYKNGLPALATKVGGLQDIVTEKTGFSFEPNQSEHAVTWVAHQINNPTEFTKLQRNTTDFVKDFGYEDHIKKLKEIYLK